MEGSNGFCYSAAVLDLDGVIMATRHLHVQAWTQAFNEFLNRQRIQNRDLSDLLKPFDPFTDYSVYVDGKPRLEGARSFLASRRITEAEEIIQAIGDRKNFYYLALLEKEGPHVFPDSLKALQTWRKRGLPMAVVSSSRNCEKVLKKGGLEDFFDVRIDGKTGEDLGLKGKPEPDYFLESAKRLKIAPHHILLVEDAEAGVLAGKRGGFGLVIGMDRSGSNTQALLKQGADRVISSFCELFSPQGAANAKPKLA